MKNPTVAIIVGSDSDLPVIKKAVKVLQHFGIAFSLSILSAHRTPQALNDFIDKSVENGVKVFIAAAGGAAHLPGVIAAKTTLPVIGVPIKTSALAGIDSLYSIIQMPAGVPVATVGIDGAKNAGLLAVQILSLSDKALRKKLVEYRKKMVKEVLEKNRQIDNI